MLVVFVSVSLFRNVLFIHGIVRFHSIGIFLFKIIIQYVRQLTLNQYVFIKTKLAVVIEFVTQF